MDIGVLYRKKEYFYYLFLISMGIAKGTDTDLPNFLSYGLILIGLFFGFFSLVFTYYTTREKIIGGIMLGIALISFLVIHKLGVLMAVVVILGAKGISYKRAFGALFLVQLFAIVYNVFPVLLGFLRTGELEGFYQSRKILGIISISDQFRSGLGFRHPNFLQICVCLGTVLILYILYDKLKVAYIIVAFAINVGFYLLTYSNTGLMLCGIYCLALIISQKYDSLAYKIGKLSKFIFVLIVVGTLLAGYFYTDIGVFKIFNQWLTGRLYWAHEYFSIIPISAFGNVGMNGNEIGMSLDCGYIFILLKYGYVILSLYCIGIYLLLDKLSREKRYPEIAVIMLLHLYFIVENFLLICFKNYSFILMAILLYNEINHKLLLPT